MQIDSRDLIKKEYILLDWNVIKYLQKPRNSADEEAKHILDSIRKRFEIPFCEAHLRDLARSYSEENKDRVNEDLDFLQELSCSVAVAVNRDNAFLLKYSANSLFQEILNEHPAQINITPDMNPQSIFKVDMSKLDQDHPMREMLERTGGVYGPGIMVNGLNDLFDHLFNEITDYKKYRNYLCKLKEDLKTNQINNLLPQDQKYKEFLITHMISFLDILEIEDKDKLASVWNDAVIKWLHMRYNGNVPYEELVTNSYDMLDFHPLFREKLKKQKNTLSNIIRDSKMVLYASKSKYFVTEDNSCYEKANFLFRTLGIKEKALKMSEFIAKFS